MYRASDKSPSDVFLVGAAQLGTVVAYAVSAFALGGRHALLLAVAWNVWSAIDACRHDR